MWVGRQVPQYRERSDQTPGCPSTTVVRCTITSPNYLGIKPYKTKIVDTTMSAPSIPNLLSLRGGRGGRGHGRGRGRGGGGGPHSSLSAAGHDTVIQGTDTDAAVSRMSAVDLGYLEDPFAQFFVQRPTVGHMTRRLPIINRGN